MTERDAVRARLAGMGIDLDGDGIDRALRIIVLHGRRAEDLTDIVLATICVEAYRLADSELPAWV